MPRRLAILLFVGVAAVACGRGKKDGEDASDGAGTCEEIHQGLANVGDACATPDALCSYGDDCGGCTYRCDGGTWALIECDCVDADADADADSDADADEDVDGTDVDVDDADDADDAVDVDGAVDIDDGIDADDTDEDEGTTTEGLDDGDDTDRGNSEGDTTLGG